jgi:hypothetical protein
MILTLIDLKGNRFKIIVSENITLSDLKDIISSKTLVESEFIRITSNGKIPIDNISLYDLKKTHLVFLNFKEVRYS